MPKKPKPTKYTTEGLIENQYEPGGKVLKNKAWNSEERRNGEG